MTLRRQVGRIGDATPHPAAILWKNAVGVLRSVVFEGFRVHGAKMGGVVVNGAHINLRLPPSLLEAVDLAAAERGVTRTS